MNNLSQLQKIQLKERDYLVPREPKEGQEQVSLTFKVIPVTNTKIYGLFNELGNMGDNPKIDKMLEVFIPIIAYSLDIPAEEVGKLDLGMIMEMFEIISEVNNFATKKESKADIGKFIKDKQELAKNKELTKSITAV